VETKETFDVIVIGAGHAGIEATHAAAKIGKRVLLTTVDIKSIGHLPCNPSIGAVGKSHLVYEIDALGGLMGIIADRACIQMRLLNKKNGPAVQAIRAQVDRHEYQKIAHGILSKTKNLTIRVGEVVSVTSSGTKDKKVTGVTFADGTTVLANSVVVASGVYLNSVIRIGSEAKKSGPSGFASATQLTDSLVKLGVDIQRFSTCTPARVCANSIDYTKTTPHPADTEDCFSQITTEPIRNLVPCYLTYTNEETHKIIRDSLKKSGNPKDDDMASPRYCPSIEDKVLRYASALRHQIFLEPEGLDTTDVYVQGIFTFLSSSVQDKFIRTIPGLENSKITNYGYGIEYDCIDSTQLLPTLEHKKVRGLFFAGQINGTSGYEEAAAQGLVAGINSTGVAKKGFVLSRMESYIGVLIDDLVTLGTKEPYRMFTSRAENRLFLRKDNADSRLTPLGREVGLVCDKRWKLFNKKMSLLEKYKSGDQSVPDDIKEIVAIESMYAGYLTREKNRMNNIRLHEQTTIPTDLNYDNIKGLRCEAQTKLATVRPYNLLQAQKISGVTPADINILLVHLRTICD